MLRSNLLFLHVLSAMALVASLGAEALALTQIWRATDAAATRPALGGLVAWQRVAAVSAILLLLSGYYLATAFWHWRGVWMGLGLLGLVVIAAVGRLVTAKTAVRLHTAVEKEDAITAVRQSHRALRASFAVRLALLIAAVYLMTVKPA